jgi:uncharacterized protein YcfL
MKKLFALVALLTLTCVGCSALKGFVKSAEAELNTVMDGAHSVVTNSAETVISPLK